MTVGYINTKENVADEFTKISKIFYNFQNRVSKLQGSDEIKRSEEIGHNDDEVSPDVHVHTRKNRSRSIYT